MTQDSLTGNGSLSLGQVAVTTWRGVVVPARSARSRQFRMSRPAPCDMGAFNSSVVTGTTETRETMTNETKSARLIEQGNGFPRVGDYVAGGSDLYRVVAVDTSIQTTGLRGNWIGADVVAADWDDCDESDVHSARVELDES